MLFEGDDRSACSGLSVQLSCRLKIKNDATYRRDCCERRVNMPFQGACTSARGDKTSAGLHKQELAGRLPKMRI